MKNIIYVLLLAMLSLSMKWVADYPPILFIAGMSWCVVGFLLVRSVLKHITKKQNK